MKKIYKYFLVLIAFSTFALSAIFAEMIICPHCGNAFDTISYPTYGDYEVISIKQFNKMRKDYIGKKIGFNQVKLYNMSDDYILFRNEDYDIVVYSEYTNEIAEQLLDLSKSNEYVNVYGTVKSGKWYDAKFYIETVR